ncbi:hypothetical protein [Enterococcus hermanniensis]|uniref:Uncharacterized protein n=1 Tax=Enterococcus hermanniensis TaxID=249189 RepID=A0A1L8TQ47_9ENTE|nr:hypothetical protein [Enterococcus hermanniensis]OJG46436.1 hypothetical protein RV04_GL000864 [Enterococcus hermanniensis]
MNHIKFQLFHDFRIVEGVQMIKKRNIEKYYIKDQHFLKEEARKTADKTFPEFNEARDIYLKLFNETKPSFADRNDREKILKVYQVFSAIALFCYTIWLFNNGYLQGSSVTNNFLLIAVVINVGISSYFNEKVTERIHNQKIHELFKNDQPSLVKLARVEEIKRNIFRAEHRGLSLVEERREKEATTANNKKNFRLQFQELAKKKHDKNKE